jgi:hypothetical protein
MQEAKKPIGLIEEMDSYIWRPESPSGPREEPLDKHNHSNDCCRYMCSHLDRGIDFEAPPRIILPEQFDWTSPRIRGSGGVPIHLPQLPSTSPIRGMFGLDKPVDAPGLPQRSQEDRR